MRERLVLPYRLILIVLLAVIGINAVAAGYGFIGTPDGSALGIPQEWLSNSPFDDYLIPGILLTSLGVLHLLGSYLQIRQSFAAPWIALASGVGLTIWIVVQALMMGSFRHPSQTILQAMCLTIGIVTSIFASKQLTTL